MTHIHDLMPADILGEMLAHGYIRRQDHPERLLSILNYSEKTAYEGVWNEATRQSRGLIATNEGVVVARPFPKFFNHGQDGAPELELHAPAVVTDKLDGSLAPSATWRQSSPARRHARTTRLRSSIVPSTCQRGAISSRRISSLTVASSRRSPSARMNNSALSANCRNGQHSFCTGSRYLAPHKSAAVGRCKCRCHG